MTHSLTYRFRSLCFLCIICLSNTCDNNNDTKATDQSPTETLAVVEETAVDTVIPEVTTVEIADTTPTPVNNTDEVVERLEETPTAPVASNNNNSGIGGLAARVVSDNKITTALEKIARNMEGKKLAYVSSLGQDCSGIYHQVKDSIQRRIPALADDDSYDFPTFRDERSSRQIADWYYRNGNLHIVQNAMADRNKIRPGSVMFYGRTDEKYNNLDIDLLTNPGVFVHDGTKGKIMHIAVVTSVEKDDAGNVVKYTIMHGRNKRHNASRSGGNWESRPGSGTAKQHKKFPFGNWNQQWVAVANIETPVN